LKEKNSKDLPALECHIPHLAYDSVIFGYHDSELHILILEYHNSGLYALPGGFVKRDENLDDAVKRGLTERTGLREVYLEQFSTFGKVNRSKGRVMKKILEANGYAPEQGHWLLDRFISVAYYALLDHSKVTPVPDALSDSMNWYPVDGLPPLIMDHKDIVKKAVEVLRQNLDKKLVGSNLLPPKFTMRALQQVYEAILGEKLTRTNFQRKILSADMVVRHEKQFLGGAHKAPYLYSFKS
tara:strand:+ start:98305 stop:99024 length:720 start_codon:yes stop_codon:yes gene_type:complete